MGKVTDEIRTNKALALDNAERLPSREKYWKELSLEGQIERLRTLLKSLVSENNTLRQELRAVKTHVHDSSGKAVVVKPLENEYGYNSGLGVALESDPDKVYI